MSLPTSDPVPRLKSEKDLFPWALRLVDFLDKHVRSLAMEDQRILLVNGDNNNINVKGGGLVHAVGPTGAFALTGIGGGSVGRFLFLHNDTAQVMTIKNNNSGSAAENRIMTYGGDIAVSVALIFYDNLAREWLVVGAR